MSDIRGISEGMTATREIVLNMNGMRLAMSSAQYMIDEAAKAGHRRSDLRWLVTSDQRRIIRKEIMNNADQTSLRRDLENGGGEDSGMFLGVPYVVRDDIQLRNDVIVLEVVTVTERIGMMEQCAVDRWTARREV